MSFVFLVRPIYLPILTSQPTFRYVEVCLCEDGMWTKRVPRIRDVKKDERRDDKTHPPALNLGASESTTLLPIFIEGISAAQCVCSDTIVCNRYVEYVLYAVGIHK